MLSPYPAALAMPVDVQLKKHIRISFDRDFGQDLVLFPPPLRPFGFGLDPPLAAQ
jgi:hypothetical protein